MDVEELDYEESCSLLVELLDHLASFPESSLEEVTDVAQDRFRKKWSL